MQCKTNFKKFTYIAVFLCVDSQLPHFERFVIVGLMNRNLNLSKIQFACFLILAEGRAFLQILQIIRL